MKNLVLQPVAYIISFPFVSIKLDTRNLLPDTQDGCFDFSNSP